MDLFDFEDKPKTRKPKTFPKIIGVAKFGRSITIGDNLDQRNHSMGDWEITNFLKIRSKYEPNTQFIFLTPSNFYKISEYERNKLFPNKNVSALNYKDLSKVDFKDQIITHPLVNNIKEVWAFAGPTSKVCDCIDGVTNDKGDILKSLYMFQRYTSPLISYLNRSKIDWYHIVTDNRYFIKSLDLINPPKKTFAQCSKEFKYLYKRIISEDKPSSFTMEEVKVIPSDILAIWLYEKNNFELKEKELDIAIVANQITGKNDSRFELIKKYFIRNNIGTIIGKWESEDYVKELKSYFYKDNNGLSSKELEELLPKFKFGIIFNYDSLEISKKNNPNLDIKNIYWLVSKIYEYIYYGVIPLFINYNNSDICNFYSIPKELIIKNEKDLKNLAYDSNMIKKLKESIITKEKINGSYFYRNGEFSF